MASRDSTAEERRAERKKRAIIGPLPDSFLRILGSLGPFPLRYSFLRIPGSLGPIPLRYSFLRIPGSLGSSMPSP